MNLTDNDTIKALECCKKAKLNQDCLDLKCPFSTKYGCNIDSEDLRNEALDIINRKQAVNELQAKEIVDLKIKTKEQKAEIERLRKVLENRGEICKSCDEKYTEKIKRAKAEAIKEFAERLIHEIVNRPSEIQSTSVEYLHGSAYRQNEIVDLVNEMVGDNNG